jgi:hypothetical protein
MCKWNRTDSGHITQKVYTTNVKCSRLNQDILQKILPMPQHKKFYEESKQKKFAVVMFVYLLCPAKDWKILNSIKLTQHYKMH